MARRRKRKNSSGEEAIFGVLVIAAGVIMLFDIPLKSILSYIFAGLLLLALLGALFWFIRGLLKPVNPKPTSPQSRNGVQGQPSDKLSADTARPERRGNTTEPPPQPSEWSKQLIASLEWRVFEKLCTKLWQAKGYSAVETGSGADGGVDFYLHASSTQQKIGAVQCKSWSKKQIGVKVLRELQGVVAIEQLKLGLLMYSGTLSKSAIEFMANPTVTIKAQGEEEILAEIQKLPIDTQKILLAELTQGDYTTPSCPNCVVKMVPRKARKSGKNFMGCPNYPRCRSVIY